MHRNKGFSKDIKRKKTSCATARGKLYIVCLRAIVYEISNYYFYAPPDTTASRESRSGPNLIVIHWIVDWTSQMPALHVKEWPRR